MSLNEDLNAASEHSLSSCLPGGPEQGLTVSSGHIVVVAVHHQVTSAAFTSEKLANYWLEGDTVRPSQQPLLIHSLSVAADAAD